MHKIDLSFSRDILQASRLRQLRIRLLTLLENEDSSQEGQICCELKHTYLDDPPQYHALSYCWGDPTVIAPILVNGSTMEVTTNLEAALRELRGQKI